MISVLGRHNRYRQVLSHHHFGITFDNDRYIKEINDWPTLKQTRVVYYDCDLLLAI